jgi:dihydroorotase
MREIKEISLRRPDDWHLHLRDDEILKAAVWYTARCFARAIIMPNLIIPVTSTERARAYRDRILDALPNGTPFTPLMTCYLTDNSDAMDIVNGHDEGIVTAVKFYPAGATTNSADGVTEISNVFGVLESMEKAGIPLLVHGETTDPSVDIFYREAVFIDRTLVPLLKRFPGLKVVFEHITTSDAVDFVKSAGPNLAATITAHHLMINRNAMFEGGLRPHMYCLPIVKHEKHRIALRAAATSGNPKFFLGTDSAPHTLLDKENACGCAGIFSSPAAMEHYTQVFDEENALDALEAFASLNGPAFYDLNPNEETIKLTKTKGLVPSEVKFSSVNGEETKIRPFMANEKLTWTLVS